MSKDNREKIEKLQDDIRKKYGDDKYNEFIEGARAIPKILKGKPPVRVNIPSAEPNDIISFGSSVSNPELTVSFKKAQEVIDQRYGELKEKYGYGGKVKAFEDLKQQLINEKRDPEKYGLKYDPEAFDRAYRKRENKRLRK